MHGMVGGPRLTPIVAEDGEYPSRQPMPGVRAEQAPVTQDQQVGMDLSRGEERAGLRPMHAVVG